MSNNPWRLPRDVTPTHYDIHLEPDLDQFTFNGEVSIAFDSETSLKQIVLNAAELEISSALVEGGPNVADIRYDAAYETVTLELADALDAGSHKLSLAYSGIINDQLRGWYRSSITDSDGVERSIATSQCQSTDARRILPCWDEPDFKATFRTTIVAADGLEAYSNAAEVSRSSTGDGRNRIEFGTTMRMSSYLLAFVVGPFEATDPIDVRGTPTRIIVPWGKLHLTDIALENAIFCFEYLSDYYGIPYPGDKLDHIAIPDFAAGAMENVGLITYRDAYLVIDPKKATQAERLSSLDVIGHEIAHQWFGNLVTMAWWEGAWLNEAFASFMELKATDARRPEWKRWLAFSNLEIPWAMGTDQLVTTRPIEFEITAPEEVDQMFDAITYGKGSAVLHMIDEFIGAESFREGVGNYLRKHAYANTVTKDLWEGLDGASEWPVSEIMNTWVFQRGFPQIEAAKTSGGVELHQRRHLAIPDESDTTIWKTPIILRGRVDGRPYQQRVLLDKAETKVAVDEEIDWLVANAGGSGFYRTSYSADLFEALLTNVEHLDENERYGLLADTLSFVRNGSLPATDFLDLVSRFGGETEQAIWSVITGGLAKLKHHALDDAGRPGFESYVRKLAGPALQRLGWESADGDTDLDRKLRGDLVAAMGNLGEDRATIARSRSIAVELMEGVAHDPEVATAALAVYARHGGRAEYDRLWTHYEKADTPGDRIRYLRSVAEASEPGLAITTMDRAIEGKIKTQDTFWVFTRLLMGDAGPDVWNDARSRWDDVMATMPGKTRGRIAEGISALSRPEVAPGIRGFFAEHPVPEATRSIAQNLEKLDANVALRQRETERVTAYFTGQGLG